MDSGGDRVAGREVLGYLLAGGAAISFSAMAAAGKGLGGELGAPQLVFVRSLFLTTFLIVWLRLRREPLLPPNHAPLLLLRGFLGTVGFILFFGALSRIPLVDTVLLFQASPLFVAALSPLLLGERNKPREWVLLGLSFLGVGFVLGLSEGGDTTGRLMALGCATTTAVALVIVRHLSREVPSLTIALAFPLVAVVLLGPGFLLGLKWLTWTPIEGDRMLLLGLVIVFGSTGQVLLTVALRYVPAAKGIALAHLQVVGAVVLGAVFFNELPGPATWGGAVLIVGCQLVLMRWSLKKEA